MLSLGQYPQANAQRIVCSSEKVVSFWYMLYLAGVMIYSRQCPKAEEEEKEAVFCHHLSPLPPFSGLEICWKPLNLILPLLHRRRWGTIIYFSFGCPDMESGRNGVIYAGQILGEGKREREHPRSSWGSWWGRIAKSQFLTAHLKRRKRRGRVKRLHAKRIRLGKIALKISVRLRWSKIQKGEEGEDRQ